MVMVSAERIRSIVADCKNEMEVAHVLRSHKIRYTFSTTTGTLALCVPYRKGTIRIYRTCSRSAPMMVHTIRSGSVNPVPVLYDY